MAINNGNYDFSLTATQSGSSSSPQIEITVKNPAACGVNGCTLRVYKVNGDVIYEKQITSSSIQTLYATPGYFGEYKVKVQGVKSGELYDWVYVDINLNSTLTYAKTFTTQDEEDWSTTTTAEQWFVGIIGIAASTLAGMIVSGFFSVLVSVGWIKLGIKLGSSNADTILTWYGQPKAGFKVVLEIYQIGSTMYTRTIVYNEYGNFVDDGISSYSVPKF